MGINNQQVQGPTDQQLTDTVEAFKHNHPGVVEAMRIFELSDQSYQASISALYGSRVTWTSSANDALTQGR